MYHPFRHDIPNDRMEQAAFAFICQNQKWITWPKYKRHFSEFKELYFGRQSWIVRPIDQTELYKIDRQGIENRREYCLATMLMTLQQRQNNTNVYWNIEGRSRSMLNRMVNMLHVTFNSGDKTREEVLAEQTDFERTTEAVIEDAICNVHSNKPIPTDLRRVCQRLISESKPLDLFLLSDDMEENELQAEAEHFRQGIHTWACPVLRRLAGVTSGVMK